MIYMHAVFSNWFQGVDGTRTSVIYVPRNAHYGETHKWLQIETVDQ